MEQRQAVFSPQGFNRVNQPSSAERAAGLAIERLPFTIRAVSSEDDLRKAVRIRHAAYARHVPEFARTLALPEDADYDEDTVVLLAESKLDGSPLGSTRIRTNLFRPLQVEESVMLPPWLAGGRLVEATRLGIDEGRVGRIVKVALIKACFMYCQENNIDYSVASGRQPIDRHYEQLMFVDVFPGELVPLRHAGNIPHRVMAFEIETFRARWEAAGHPLLDFFLNTQHPDIDISRPADVRLVRTPKLQAPERQNVVLRELEVA
jgi:hypothetical protein